MPSATRWSPSCCTASATACKATSRLAKVGNTPIGMRSFAPSRVRSGPSSAGSSRRSRSTPRRRNWWGPSRMAAERGGRPRRRNVSARTTSSFPGAGGKAIPYGVYDPHRNEGWVSVGIDHDMATFAVRSIRRWWQHMRRPVYRDAVTLLITADAGPTASTARRSRSARSFCSTSAVQPDECPRHVDQGAREAAAYHRGDESGASQWPTAEAPAVKTHAAASRE